MIKEPSLHHHCDVLGSLVQKGSDLREVFLLLFFMWSALGSKGCIVIPVEYVSSSKRKGSSGHLCDIFKPWTTFTESSAFLSSFLCFHGSLWRCLMVAWGLIIPHPVITSSPLPSGSCQLSAKPPNHSPRPPCWTCLTPPGSPRRHSGATTWGPVTNHVIFALSPWFPFLLLFISSCSSSLCVLTLPSCSLSPSFLPPPSPSTLFQL